MNEKVSAYVERLAELLASPTFAEESRRRKLNERFQVLDDLRRRNLSSLEKLHHDKPERAQESK